MKILNYLLMLGIITTTFTSCYYDNTEELYPQPVECDTINVTYSQTIAPIMNTNCNDCHSGAAPPANVITDNYTDLKTIADDGRLWGSINHESGYSPMPKDRPKMNDCDLKKINIWLDNGALND
jgi:hypothetical protein